MIAVCLLTCGRFSYTAVTLSSFAQYNEPSRFTLLHADDASSDRDVPALARDYGFTTVAQSSVRQGWLTMRRKLFAAAARRGAQWIVFLENDIEWARPFPWALFDYLRRSSSVYCLRLQGAFKDRAQHQPCMAYHKSDRRKPVSWKPIKYAPEKSHVGWIHWSAQPSVTRTHDLRVLHEYGMESSSLTARVVENVTYHIGSQRTAQLAVSA